MAEPSAGHGDPLMPGEIGSAPGQGFPGQNLSGTAQQQPKKEFEPGTADYAVQQLVLKMQAGTTAGLSELISEKSGDEILAPLRDGSASDAQIKAAQELATSPKIMGKREAGTTMMYYIRNAGGEVLTFSVRRDDDSKYRVTSLKVEEPRGRR